MTTFDTADRIWKTVRLAALIAPDRLNADAQIKKLAAEIDEAIAAGVKAELAKLPNVEALREKCERLDVALEISQGNLRAERLRVKSVIGKVESAEKRERRRKLLAEEMLVREHVAKIEAEHPAFLRGEE